MQAKLCDSWQVLLYISLACFLTYIALDACAGTNIKVTHHFGYIYPFIYCTSSQSRSRAIAGNDHANGCIPLHGSSFLYPIYDG
jgi:hypothetical protein